MQLELETIIEAYNESKVKKIKELIAHATQPAPIYGFLDFLNKKTQSNDFQSYEPHSQNYGILAQILPSITDTINENAKVDFGTIRNTLSKHLYASKRCRRPLGITEIGLNSLINFAVRILPVEDIAAILNPKDSNYTFHSFFGQGANLINILKAACLNKDPGVLAHILGVIDKDFSFASGPGPALRHEEFYKNKNGIYTQLAYKELTKNEQTYSSFKKLELLIKSGANLNAEFGGKTILERLDKSWHREVIDLCVAFFGKNVNVREKHESHLQHMNQPSKETRYSPRKPLPPSLVVPKKQSYTSSVKFDRNYHYIGLPEDPHKIVYNINDASIYVKDWLSGMDNARHFVIKAIQENYDAVLAIVSSVTDFRKACKLLELVLSNTDDIVDIRNAASSVFTKRLLQSQDPKEIAKILEEALNMGVLPNVLGDRSLDNKVFSHLITFNALPYIQKLGVLEQSYSHLEEHRPIIAKQIFQAILDGGYNKRNSKILLEALRFFRDHSKLSPLAAEKIVSISAEKENEEKELAVKSSLYFQLKDTKEPSLLDFLKAEAEKSEHIKRPAVDITLDFYLAFSCKNVSDLLDAAFNNTKSFVALFTKTVESLRKIHGGMVEYNKFFDDFLITAKYSGFYAYEQCLHTVNQGLKRAKLDQIGFKIKFKTMDNLKASSPLEEICFSLDGPDVFCSNPTDPSIQAEKEIEAEADIVKPSAHTKNHIEVEDEWINIVEDTSELEDESEEALSSEILYKKQPKKAGGILKFLGSGSKPDVELAQMKQDDQKEKETKKSSFLPKVSLPSFFKVRNNSENLVSAVIPKTKNDFGV